MAMHCSSFFFSSCSYLNRTKLFSSQSPSLHPSSSSHLPITFPNRTKLQNIRLDRHISAVVSEKNAVGSSFSGHNSIKLTYLEGNSWLWEVGGVRILVDPILVGNLDFGVPWLYDAAKKILRSFQLKDLPELDCLLITQSLDDHCHQKTLKPLSEMFPDLRVISTPNAESILNPLFGSVTYLEPSQSSEIEGKNGSTVGVRATAGPVLGPPWQRPENGYLIISPQSQLTLYFEPHCVYNQAFLQKEQADIVITPVIKQLLPSFTLVSGQEDAIKLASLLQAKYVVPMNNGDLDSKGLLSSILYSEGTIESFKGRADDCPSCQHIRAVRIGLSVLDLN